MHGLIRGAKIHFQNGRAVEEGAYLKPYKKLLVDVTSSAACLDKALDLANDLFNALESVGYRVAIAPADSKLRRITIDEREKPTSKRDPYYHSGPWSPYRPTVVYLGSVAIGLAIVEMSEQVTLRYVNGKYIRESDYIPPKRGLAPFSWTTTSELPSGRIRIIAYSPYGRVEWSTEWSESGKSASRATIETIVKALEEAAPELVEKLEEADRQAEIERQKWLVEEERRRRAEDRRCVAQSIKESHEQLNGIIQRWGELMDVERFLEGVEARMAERPEAERLPILRRLTLAREFLGNQSPLDAFCEWLTPEERYRSPYGGDENLDG
ncbi:MAG TPA: hypothetical protein VFT56_07290 [Sphingomonas sp.]|nr:hypothetical protein [Sphingomonas sp.]